ncbi:MAG: hypothetical protein QXT00_09205, partial [Ignisphaera sp.]
MSETSTKSSPSLNDEAITKLEIGVLKAMTQFTTSVSQTLKRQTENFDDNGMGAKELVIYNLIDLLHESTTFTDEVYGHIYKHIDDIPSDFNFLTMLVKLAILDAKVQVHNILADDVEEMRQTIKTVREAIGQYVDAVRVISLPDEAVTKLKESVKKYLTITKSLIGQVLSEVGDSPNSVSENANVNHLVNELNSVGSNLQEEIG